MTSILGSAFTRVRRVAAAASVALMAASCALGTDAGPEEPVASASAGLTNSCVVGCPAGWHAVRNYCTYTCGGYDSCTYAYNSTECERDDIVPAFTKCGTGGCPGGYMETERSCSTSCQGSPTAICGFGRTNATRCTALPQIDRITDAFGSSNVRAGETIVIHGQRFARPKVIFTQYAPGTNVIGATWEAYEGSAHWSSDRTTITTVLPANVWTQMQVLVKVENTETRAGSNVFAGAVLPPAPPPPPPPPPPSQPSGYVGCFTDSEARALPVWIGGGHTIESCKAVVASQGLPFAGLQFYGECFGGFAPAYAQVSDAECNTPCSANPAQTCGGAWRNSIYTTP